MNPQDIFRQEAREVLKHSGNRLFYIYYFDITNFMIINYYYGQDVGNRYLYALEQYLENVPEFVLSHRIFSDHFLCLVNEAGGSEANTLKLLDRVANRFLIKQHSFIPDCNPAIAGGICRLDIATLDEAIDNANLAHKESKKKGSLRTVAFSEIIENNLWVHFMQEQSIHYAFENHEFCFYLQPKVDLKTGRIVGSEALARRITSDGSVISPDNFLDFMESDGSVVKLDFLIFHQVCAFLAERRAKGLPVLPVSVNLSRLHISHADTANQLQKIADEYDIPSSLLEFEITETILLDEFSDAKTFIDKLRNHGYKVSIDDFGSGYAGINVWQELNFDVLKLDRKFLNMGKELQTKNQALLPNIINIGHRLNIVLLCEGVEEKSQCEYLLRMGCSLVQGYYFSEPVTPEEFYHTYEEQDGAYPISIQDEFTSPEKPSKKSAPHEFTKYFLVSVILILFLGIATASSSSYFGNYVKKQFDEMSHENINAYTLGQKEKTQSMVDRLVNTLQTLAILVEKNNDQEFVDTCLTAASKEQPDTTFMYSSKEYFENAISSKSVSSMNQDIYKRLLSGETVVSQVTYSKRMGGIYCIACAIPVTRDGEFIGAVRAISNAEFLTDFSVYPNTQNQVLWSLLISDDGAIIPVTSEQEAYGTLDDFLTAQDASDALVGRIKGHLLSSDTDAFTDSSGTSGGDPLYVSGIPLEYNGWHLLVGLRAKEISVYSSHIISSVRRGAITQTLIVLVVCVLLFLVLHQINQRFARDKRKYLLLEQFSDVCLFEYDTATDFMHLTPNADKLIALHATEQAHFLRNLKYKWVYAGDQEELKNMLLGKIEQDQNGIRVRFLSPDQETYFWCHVQFHYIYQGDTLTSVIGKITNIEEQSPETE